MSITLASLQRGVRLRAPRVIVLGVEKIGKTTFSCGTTFDENGKIIETGINGPVVIPVKGEEGVDALDVPVFPTCTSFQNLMEALTALYVEEHEYRTVVVDSASALEPLVWDSVCQQYNVDSIEKVDGGYGKGYTAAVSEFRKLLDGLDALRAEKNMASIIIGHVKVKRFDDPAGESYDQFMFDVHDKVANLLFRWSDLILFCNTKVVVKKEDQGFGKETHRGIDVSGGKRFLFTQKRPAHPGGGRGAFGQLPYELPLDYLAFQTAVEAAAAEAVAIGGEK